MSSSIIRPSWLAAHRATLLKAVAIVVGFSYVVWLVNMRPEPRTIPISIPMAIPTPVLVPSPPPPLIEVQREAPRLFTPNLVSGCTIQELLVDPAPDPVATRCSYDDGLPAISSDGSTIIALFSEGESSLKVRFIEVASSKVTKEVVILAPKDLDEHGHATPATGAAIIQRATSVQKALDAGRYRSLVVIPQVDVGSERVPGLSMLYDRDDDPNEVSVIDEDANLVLWKDRFVATERGYPARKLPEDYGPDCYPSTTSSIATWWDPRTRTILAKVTYSGMACDCPTWSEQYYTRHVAEL